MMTGITSGPLETLGKMVERFKSGDSCLCINEKSLSPTPPHEEVILSRAIQWLSVSISVWYNRRHQRSGHLFQGRFKSFLIENDRYFTAMCLYIHWNPLRAGIARGDRIICGVAAEPMPAKKRGSRG